QLEDTKKAWQRALLLLDNGSDDYAALSQQLSELDAVIQTSGVAPTLETEDAILDDIVPETNKAPGITQQNVEQQEADIVSPQEDAPINLGDL
ncbi:MAG: hypothetical protein HOC16_05035, partial [Candidatus Pacebacteria bacterium]|nr:hypothetical protein [Candidatus Paceibacterota bacterium]